MRSIARLAFVMVGVFALVPVPTLATVRGGVSDRTVADRVPRLLPPDRHGRILVARPQLRRRDVTVRVTVTDLRAPVVLEVDIRIIRAHHAVLDLAVAQRTGDGTRTFSFRLPRSLHRPFRVVADAVVMSGAGSSGAVGEIAAGARVGRARKAHGREPAFGSWRPPREGPGRRGRLSKYETSDV